ncbi:hypothetical protein PIB30_056174 [Stylosanthes scabra]|uniref:Uncharacterized protein n=1 Tax=Stylosanthes scabra TaxID=79078 RepID=A0ABU6SJ96_9FABA|nr:hypothetical protein [Stylosanthes scabra]
MLRVCSPVIGLDHDGISELLRKLDLLLGCEVRTGVYFSLVRYGLLLPCKLSAFFIASEAIAASRISDTMLLSSDYEVFPTDGTNVKVESLNDCLKDFEWGA